VDGSIEKEPVTELVADASVRTAELDGVSEVESLGETVRSNSAAVAETVTDTAGSIVSVKSDETETLSEQVDEVLREVVTSALQDPDSLEENVDDQESVVGSNGAEWIDSVTPDDEVSDTLVTERDNSSSTDTDNKSLVETLCEIVKVVFDNVLDRVVGGCSVIEMACVSEFEWEYRGVRETRTPQLAPEYPRSQMHTVPRDSSAVSSTPHTPCQLHEYAGGVGPQSKHA
jgi:hypothetical protein